MRSVRLAAAIVLLSGLAIATPGAAFWPFKHKQPKPVIMPHRAAVGPAAHVPLYGFGQMPAGFELNLNVPPVWLSDNEFALLGIFNHRPMLLGFRGAHFAQTETLAEAPQDNGSGLLDLALSPDHSRLALAYAGNDSMWVHVQSARPGSGGAAADFDVAGLQHDYARVQLGWLDAHTLALGLDARPASSNAPTASSNEPTADPPPNALKLFDLDQPNSGSDVALDCLAHIDPASIAWSPNGRYAVARGNVNNEWFVFARETGKCAPVNPAVIPLRFLQWAPSSDRFLYTAAPAGAPTATSVLEYSLADGRSRVLASPATAATYLAQGRIAVLGSQQLNAAALASRPDVLVPAEIAWIDPATSEMQITDLGAMLPASTLMDATVFASPGSERLQLLLNVPGPGGPYPALLWARPIAAGNGGIRLLSGLLATGGDGSTMVASGSPDGDKVVVVGPMPQMSFAVLGPTS